MILKLHHSNLANAGNYLASSELQSLAETSSPIFSLQVSDVVYKVIWHSQNTTKAKGLMYMNILKFHSPNLAKMSNCLIFVVIQRVGVVTWCAVIGQ